MKKIFLLLVFMAFCHNVNAQYTVHVLNPWRNDDAPERQENLRISGEESVGYYPGSDMIPEGNGWFYHTFETKPKNNPRFQFVNWIGPALHIGRVVYPYKFSVDSTFALASESNEVWIVILDPDSLKMPTIYSAPQDGKVIKIFNPWPENSSQLIIGKNTPLKMQRDKDHCGWYESYFAGSLDRLSQLVFTDYYHSQYYGNDGMVSKLEGITPIDLEEYAQDNDTIYILPRPFPSGAPSITSSFPGRLGDCGVKTISCLFRDWKEDNKSFILSGGEDTSVNKGMVLTELGDDGKPTPNPASKSQFAPYVNSWFQTYEFPDGSKNDTCIDIELTKGEDGLWEYDSDKDKRKGFFLLDDFDNPNNIKYEDAYKAERNFHFSMETHLMFMYHQGAGLRFDFTGDDDVWVFINNKLAIDIGGLNYLAKGSIDLDKNAKNLGLEDGKMYSIDMFYAERKPTGSNFKLRTSMNIVNSDELYTREKTDPSVKGKIEYEIWQKIVTESNECGVTTVSGEESLAEVVFYLASPLFDKEEQLDYGKTYYGGIYVDPSKSKVTIDSSALTGLAYGEYQIIFRLGDSRSGYLTFSVVPNYHHVDIQVPTFVSFDKNKDTKIDTVFLPLGTDSVNIYAVLRDPNGLYIERANPAKWQIVSKDTAFTLSKSPVDGSIQMIVKQKTGNGWIYARYEDLIYDSVFVITEIDPKWVEINSATMLDNNGDLTPDLVRITLSDTFEVNHKLVSVKIDYKEHTYTIPSSECTLDKNVISVPFESLTGIDGTPSGTITLDANIEGKAKKREAKFTDGVGAGLTEAAVLENDGVDKDVLFLTFSEKIIPETIKGKQLILIKNETTDTTVLVASGDFTIIDDFNVSVTLEPSEKIHPIAGDDLRLVPGISDGKILDLNKNLPHELNPSVTLKLKLGAAPISSSFYEDTDANGFLDRVTINFKRKVTLPEFDSVHLYWNLKHGSVLGSKLNVENDTSLVFNLEESYVGKKPLTDGSMYLAVHFKVAPDINRTSYAEDKAAPVLTSASFYPGRFKDSNANREKDTLITTFSEKVDKFNNKPFVFTSGKNKYAFNLSFLKNSGDKYVFSINEITPENTLPSSGDTARIDVSAKISDTLNNAQLNEKNKPVLLNVVEPAHEWRTKIGKNPLYMGETITMQVHPIAPFNISKYSTSITFFDPVGSEVYSSVMKFTGGHFEHIWNGRNSRGRQVGSGVYVGIITIKDNDGKAVWKNVIKVGIKNKK